MIMSEADIAFALELFDPLGGLTVRKMFGGMCLYHDGTVFALISADRRLYLKAKDDVAADLIAEGGEQFHKMPYWSLPEDALEDLGSALVWAKQTLATL